MGRHTLLTPELSTIIVDLLKRGQTVEGLCKQVGIGVSTYYKWVADGKKEGAEKIFIEFMEATESAMGNWELAQIEGIKDRKWLLTHHPATKERWADLKHEVIIRKGRTPEEVRDDLLSNIETLRRNRRERNSRIRESAGATEQEQAAV